LIKWTDIDNEVEEFQSGYRSGFVAIFKKYEGMETDERTAQNKVVVVGKANFAERYGINRTTFQRWVAEEMTGDGHVLDKRPGLNEKMAKAAEEAAAKATAEAEAKAAKALAEALERQKREHNLAEAKRAAEAAAKIRAEEQKKAAEAAAKEIAALKAKMAETAKAAEFDISTLTEAQKAQVMTLLANDPEKASEWFKAQTAERARKLAEAEKAAKEAAAKKRQQMEERESRQAAERARKDYDASALKDFIAITKAAKALQEKLRNKPVTFDHVLTSGLSAQEWVSMTELVEDVAVEVRESLFSINAEQELKS